MKTTLTPAARELIATAAAIAELTDGNPPDEGETFYDTGELAWNDHHFALGYINSGVGSLIRYHKEALKVIEAAHALVDVLNEAHDRDEPVPEEYETLRRALFVFPRKS